MGICNNRTVIITGAGGGLGKAYAEALAAEGANVVVNDIRLDAAQAVVDAITAQGGKALANSGDITDMAGAQSIVDAALAAYRKVHAVVNNDGIVRAHLFLKMLATEWADVIRVHLPGTFFLAKHTATTRARSPRKSHTG